MSVSLGETNLFTRLAEHEKGPEALAVRDQLERILSSRIFRPAKGQSKFLRYVVEQALEGHADRIKEYSIGVEVFGRGESFDPRANNIVRTEANRLRSKLAKYYEDEGRGDELRIELPKGGYAPVFIENSTPPATVDPAPAAAKPFPIRGWQALAIGAAICVVLAAGVWLIRRDRSSAAENPSIAVLPFLNLNEHSEEEFISDGLTDELIESLGQIPGLHVVARTSAFQYKGKNIDVRQIGKELNVRTVLEGSVREYGGRIRVNTQLDDTGNGYRIWSRTFDRETSDVLAMQQEISQAIVDALGIDLAAGGVKRLSNHVPNPSEARNPEAYRSYLKGVYFSNKHTGENVQKAIAYFEDAIAKYPDYAPAYVGLARSYTMIPSFTGIPTLEIAAKWKAAVRKGLALDESAGQAHLQLAQIYVSEYAWAEADKEFRKGLELDPGDADGYRVYSQYLAKTGHLDLAIAAARKALDLDPVSAGAATSLGKYLYQSRRFQEAIEEYHSALALDPNDGIAHQGLGLTFLGEKMYSEGIAETETSSRIMGRDPFITGQLGYAFAVSGNSGKAREILKALLQRPDARGILSLAVANIYIGLGDKDRAFEWLQKCVDQQDTLLFMQSDPLYDALRGDPRFTGLLRRMRLI